MWRIFFDRKMAELLTNDHPEKQNPGLSLAENIDVEQYKIKVFLCSYLLILKILSATLFSDPTTAILTLLLQTATCDPLKSYRKPPKTIKFLRIFAAANEESTQENIDQSQQKNFYILLYTSI
jgi:hypothetical protein